VVRGNCPAVARRHRHDEELREKNTNQALSSDELFWIPRPSGAGAGTVEQHISRMGVAEALLRRS
jgi:hypothetical protein